MSEDLWLWVLAGSNGAGKSTFAPNLPVYIIINPDDIAREFDPNEPEKAALKAGREAMRRMQELIRQRRSFAVETTLSGRFHLQIANAAKAEGWNIGLVYIGLRNAEIAIGRIRERTISGGHKVSADDVRRRFERSLGNLAAIYPMTDWVLLFDNSSTRQKMKRIMEVRRGNIVFKVDRLPDWVRRSLGAITGSG
jgi:predicted ABC-type ATPase